MPKLQLMSSLAILFLLAACGGGGGSSGGGTNNEPSQPTPTPSPEAADSEAPTLSLDFPLAGSTLLIPTYEMGSPRRFEVTGRAADNEAVVSLKVNGETSPKGHGDPADYSRWRARAMAPPGSTEFSLTAEDAASLSSDPKKFTLVNDGPWLEWADSMIADPNQARFLIGIGEFNQIIEVDLASGQRSWQSVGEIDYSSGRAAHIRYLIAVDDAHDDLLFIDSRNDIVRKNLTDGSRSVIASIDSIRGSNGSEVTQFGDWTVDPSLENLYFLALSGEPVVFSVSLLTGQADFIASSTHGSGTPLTTTLGGIAVDHAANTLYVSQWHQLIAIDLTNGNRSIASNPLHNIGTGPRFSARPGALLLNESASHVYLSTYSESSSSTQIVSVDTSTGDRRIVSDDIALGSGPQVSAPAHELILVKGQLYAMIRGLYTVMTIDPRTGDRALLGTTLGDGVAVRSPQRGDVDGANGLVYVADNKRKGVIRTNLATNVRTIQSSAYVGSGPVLENPVALDVSADGETLFVSDFTRGAIFEVEAASGNRKIISDAVIGTGPAIAKPSSLVFDDSRGQLYVSNPKSRFIYKVERENGARAVFLDGADMGYSSSFRPISVEITSDAQTLYIGARDTVESSYIYLVIACDLTSGACATVADSRDHGEKRFHIDSIKLIDDEQGLLLHRGTQNQFWRLDLSTGDVYGPPTNLPKGNAFAHLTTNLIGEMDGYMLVYERNSGALAAVHIVIAEQGVREFEQGIISQ